MGCFCGFKAHPITLFYAKFSKIIWYFRVFFVSLRCIKNIKDMSKTKIILPDSFVKGLICKVHVSLNGKNSCKELKVCSVKARSVIFIEVDKVNRQNIFRKVDKVDIVNFKPTAICEITVKDGILPVKWESAWDSIGQPSNSVQSYGRFATAARGLASQRTKHFPVVIKAPMGSSIDALAANPSWKNSTTNSAAGFPMV